MLGRKVENFEAPATGATFKLADHTGTTIVLYFYPKDNTPGCTTEGANFRDAYPKFLKAIGQTVAATKKHKKSLGRLVPTTDLGIALYKQGFDFCCYSGDVWVLRDALAAAVKTVREGCK